MSIINKSNFVIELKKYNTLNSICLLELNIHFQFTFIIHIDNWQLAFDRLLSTQLSSFLICLFDSIFSVQIKSLRMLSETFFEKVHKILAFNQSHLAPLPINIDERTKILASQPIQIRRHVIFLVCNVAGYVLGSISVLVILRALLFEPKYLKPIELVFLCFYIAVSIIFSTIGRIVVNDREAAITLLNRSFAMLQEHKTNGNLITL